MLLPQGRRRIVEVFFANPYSEVHLRELARLSEASRGNVDQSMRLFVQEKMFIKRTISNMTFFKPNLANHETLKLFEFIEIEKRKQFLRTNKQISRMLTEYTTNVVAKSNNSIQMVILFGSVARGDWTKKSDIDILAVASKKDKPLLAILEQEKTNVSPLLEIRPILTTVAKFTHGLHRRLEFYDELWRDRVILYNEFLFWQLVKEAARENEQAD